MKRIGLLLALLAAPLFAGSELIYEVGPLNKKKADKPAEAKPAEEKAAEASGMAGGVTAEEEEEKREAPDEKDRETYTMRVAGEGPNAAAHDPVDKVRLVINGEIVYLEELSEKKVLVLDAATRAKIKAMRGDAGAGPAGGGGNEAVVKPLRDAVEALKASRSKLPANADGARKMIDQQIEMYEKKIAELGGKAGGGEPAGKRLVKSGKRVNHGSLPCLVWYYMDGKTVLQEIHVTAPGNLELEPAFLKTLKRLASALADVNKDWFSAVIATGYIPAVIHDNDEEETSRLIKWGKCTVHPKEVQPTPGLERVKLG